MLIKHIDFISIFIKSFDRIYMWYVKSKFNNIGNNVIFHPINSHFSYNSISIGNNVWIGDKAYFHAKISHIYIGNNIMFAPKVTIRGGNHRYDIIGKLITDYKDSDKRKEDDEPVYIEDDCWIGTNCTILKGVRIRRGSVVAAGSVVNKSFPPYAIIGGVPAKILKFRWDSIDTIMEHERLLYKEEDRLSRATLCEYFKEYQKH